MLSTDWSYPQIAGTSTASARIAELWVLVAFRSLCKLSERRNTNFGKRGTRHLIAMNLYG